MRTGDLVGSDLPLQTTGGNWATTRQAEVDGILSSRGDLWNNPTVFVRMMFNVIADHPDEESKCQFCSRVDLEDTPIGMHVPAMTPEVVACRPYPWLA